MSIATKRDQVQDLLYGAFRSAATGIAVLDNKACIIEANDAFLKTFEYSQNEIKDLKFKDLLLAAFENEFSKLIKKLPFGSEKHKFLEWKALKKDKSIITVLLNFTEFTSENNENYITVTVEDISDKINERNVNEQIALITKKTNNSIFILNPQYKIIWVNEGFENLHGCKINEIKNQPIDKILHNFDKKNIFQLKENLNNKHEYSFEHQSNSKNGKTKWLKTDIVSLNGKTVNDMKYIAVQTDISLYKLLKVKTMALIDSLTERVKELNGLHQTAKLLQQDQIKNSTILKKLAQIIKEMFQFPEITEVFVKFDKDEYKTLNFNKKAVHKLTEKFEIDDHKFELNVIYTKTPENFKGKTPFLKEEKAALRSVNKMIHSYMKSRFVLEALKESEESYHGLFDTVSEAIYVQDVNGKFLNVNKSSEKMYGYPKNYFIGKTPEFLSAEEKNDLNDTLRRVKQTLTKGVENRFEWWGKRKDGSIFPKEVILNKGRYFGKDVVIVTARDITEKYLQEKKIRDSELLYRTLTHNLPDSAVTILDKDYKVIFVDGQILQDLGYKKEDFLDKTLIDIVPPNEFEISKKRYAKAFKGYQIEFERQDGELYFKYFIVPLKSETGEIEYVMTFSQNITVPKVTEAKLREREHLLKSINTNIQEGIYRSTPKGKIVYSNPAFAKLFGFESVSEVGKMSAQSMYKNPSIRKEFIEKLKSNHSIINEEVEFVRKDGKIFWGLMNTISTSNQGNVYFDGAIKDITDWKIAQKQLRLSLEEKEILLKEIHHRVKNNMAIIYSLLELQSGSFTDEKVLQSFKESQRRIKSMALIHEKLYETFNLAEIEFGTYIKELAVFIISSYRFTDKNIELNVKADDEYLDINHAIPCGLIVNELVSNACKHAFKKNEKGKINLSFQRKKDLLELIVSDNGCGLAEDFSISGSKSLGMTLVSGLCNQLNASIKIESKKGSRFIIKFSKEKPKIL